MAGDHKAIEVLPVEGGVLEVCLDRPDRRNAIDVQMVLELDEVLGAATADEEVRVLVLGANGSAFSSGHEMQRDTGLDKKWEDRRATHEGRFRVEDELYRIKNLALRDFPKPTIARVQGPAVAAGWMLASMCDLIVASEDARFQNPVVRMATSGPQLLFEPWDVGVRKAKEILFTGGWVGAREALALGGVNRVVASEELDDHTRALAEDIAAMPPWALRLVKQSLNHTLDVMGQRESWDYQFLIRNIGHASQERADFMADRRAGRSVREFVAERDRSFDDSAP